MSRTREWLLARARQGSRSALGRWMVSCRPWLQRGIPSQNRQDPLGPAGIDGPGGEPAEAPTSILARLSRGEQVERLRLAASWCRPDDLEILSLHLFQGRSHDEIAAELGIAVAAARRRYGRAVRRVGEAMLLLDRMTRLGWGALRQDVIGVHRFQGAEPAQVAEQLQVPEELATRWIVEAGPLFGATAGERNPS